MVDYNDYAGASIPSAVRLGSLAMSDAEVEAGDVKDSGGGEGTEGSGEANNLTRPPVGEGVDGGGSSGGGGGRELQMMGSE